MFVCVCVCGPPTDTVSGKLQNNNIYTIAKRNVEGQDMLYQSLKLTNGIWILAELRIQPGNPNYTVNTFCNPISTHELIVINNTGRSGKAKCHRRHKS